LRKKIPGSKEKKPRSDGIERGGTKLHNDEPAATRDKIILRKGKHIRANAGIILLFEDGEWARTAENKMHPSGRGQSWNG